MTSGPFKFGIITSSKMASGAKAGIHQGDVIQGWNGQPIRSLSEVLRALGPASVGTTVPVALSRGGETRAVDLVVGERPDR